MATASTYPFSCGSKQLDHGFPGSQQIDILKSFRLVVDRMDAIMGRFGGINRITTQLNESPGTSDDFLQAAPQAFKFLKQVLVQNR